MPDPNFSVTGLNEAVAKFNKIIKTLPESTLKAKVEIGLDLQRRSVKLAPLDTADLRGSAFTKVEGDYVIVGYTEPYALKQHEHTEYEHPRGGEAKYLEKPFKENMKRYIKLLEDSVKRVVE